MVLKLQLSHEAIIAQWIGLCEPREKKLMSKRNSKKALSNDEKLQMFGWILTDSVYDLSVPAEIYRDYYKAFDNKPPQPIFEGVVRLCRFSTVIAVCKFYDALEKYNHLLIDAPVDLKDKVKAFKRYVLDKDYRTLRSKFVAHNFDAYESHSYADGHRIAEAIFGITGGDMLAYFEWIKPSADNVGPDRYHPSYLASDLKEYIRSLVVLVPRV